MHIVDIFVFLGIAILSSINCKNFALGMINKIGTNWRRYPKGYIATTKWVKKRFNLNRRVIPRYLYFELILSRFFSFLGLINIVILAVSGGNATVKGVLIMLHCCLIIINAFYVVIMSFIYKKN